MATRKPLFLLLLSLAAAAVPSAAVANASTAFRTASICPPPSVSANLTGLQFEAACTIECAARPDCVAAAHSASQAACRLAGAAQFAGSWRSGDCRSSVSASRLMAGGGLAPALTPGTRASLLAFHNFRLGTPNLASSANRSFAATLGPGARATMSGVWLDGGASSYIEIDTESGNLTNYLNYGSQFTYFAKYQRMWQPGQTLVFIQQFLSPSYAVSGGDWMEFRSNANSSSTMVTIKAQFMSDRVQTTLSKASLLPVDDALTVFTAATFSGTEFSQLYWNGTSYPGTKTYHYSNYTSDWNSKLVLGKHNSNTNWNMRGYFICWGVAAGMLTPAQLDEVNSLC